MSLPGVFPDALLFQSIYRKGDQLSCPFPLLGFCGTLEMISHDCLSGTKGNHMGFHTLDIIVLIGVALLLFGPRTLQSISHSAGRGMGHAKDVKDTFMKELPVEELSQVSNTISRIPTSPQQVAQKLLGSALKSGEKKEESPATHEIASESSRQPEERRG